jgi:hypothetical protein
VEYLGKMRRLINARGKIFCTVPNWDCEEVQNSVRKDWLPPIHKLFFNKKSLHKLAEVCGFKNIRIGLVHTDPFAGNWKSRMKWMLRRACMQHNMKPGLWLLTAN